MQGILFARRLAMAGLAAASLVAAPALAQDTPAPADAAAASNAGATPIAGIQRIIDDFIVRVTTDPRIKRRFETTNLPRLNLLLVQQICYLTGGPCAYTGRDMRTAHASLGLHNDDFNALAEDLQLSMDREGVAFTAQNQLLAKLAPMQRQIVTR